jgi:hypothetical protein
VYSIIVGQGGLGGIGAAFYDCNISGYGSGLPGQNGQDGGASGFNGVLVDGGKGGIGGTSAGCYRSQAGYPLASNGTNGASGNNGAIINYDYPYSSIAQVRSYIPVSYVPVYPFEKSNKGAGGIANGGVGAKGEDGYVVIIY